MMNTISNIKAIIANRIKQQFRNYPVAILESPEDTSTLWVRVFAVPPENVRAVKNYIHILQDQLLPDNDIILLPMVKNIEVTRQHYPEYMSQEPAAYVTQIAEKFLLETELGQNKWQVVSCSSFYSSIYHTPMVKTALSWDKSMGGQLHPVPTYGKEVAANNELAMAA